MKMKNHVVMNEENKSETQSTNLPSKRAYTDSVMKLGGITSIQVESEEKVLKCIPLSESGFFGLVTLRNSI